MEEKENKDLISDEEGWASTNNPTKEEISEIMNNIRSEVLIESHDDQKLQKHSTNAFLLTPDMKVENSSTIDLKMSLEELKNLIKEIVREEVNKS